MAYELIGVFFGFILGIGGTLGIRKLDENRAKKSLSKAFLEEIKGNQRQLEGSATIASQVPEDRQGDILLAPIAKSFQKTIFEASADKIGLLDFASELIKYYEKLSFLSWLRDTIHWISPATMPSLTEEKCKLLKQTQTKDYFRNVKETYEFGNELIKRIDPPS